MGGAGTTGDVAVAGRDPGPPDDAAGRTAGTAKPWLALAALALGAAAAIISQTLVLPVLPELAREFDVTQTDAIWVMTVNLLAATVFSPLVGRLGDAWGRKRILLAALCAVLAGSVLAAVASEFWLVLAGRALQGTAFGVIALAISIVRDTFPKERVSLGIALISAIMGIGGGAGLVISGLLAEAGDFQLIFWFSAGMAAVGIAGVLAIVPESEGGGDRSLDIPGMLLLGGWLTCLVLAVDRGHEWGWDSGEIIGLFVGAAVLLAAWVVVEYRVRVPMVDMKVFVRPVVLGTNITGLLIGLGMFGAFTLINQFVQTPQRFGYGFSADALEAGLTLLPMTAGTLVAAPLTSMLITRIGPKVPMVSGGLVAALSFGMLAIWNTEQWHFLVAMGVLGLGIGLAMAAMPQMLNLGVPHSQTGIANGMNSTLRELGSSAGSAMAAAMLSGELIPRTPVPTLNAFETAFVVSAALALVATVAAVLIPQRRAMAAQAAEYAGDTPRVAAVEVAVASAHDFGAGETGDGREIRGRVRQPRDGGLAGVALTLTDAYGRQVERSSTREDGSFRLPVPSTGPYVLITSAPGRQPHASQVLVGERPVAVDITLTGCAGLTGTVTSTGNWPVSGARVVLTAADGEVVHTTTTGKDGRYAFEALVAGSHTVVVNEDAHRLNAMAVQIPDTGQTACDIVLLPAAALVGTVRAAANGHGIGNARMTLLDNLGNEVAAADTDQDGNYRLTGLASGDYTLIATGYPPVAHSLHINGDGLIEHNVELGHPAPGSNTGNGQDSPQ